MGLGAVGLRVCESQGAVRLMELWDSGVVGLRVAGLRGSESQGAVGLRRYGAQSGGAQGAVELRGCGALSGESRELWDSGAVGLRSCGTASEVSPGREWKRIAANNSRIT